MTGDTVGDCLFCKIVAGEIPADIVARDDKTVAFRDINPQAEVHLLVVPQRHEPDVGSLAAADPEAMLAVLATARRLGLEAGDGAYRLVFNTGAAAGQTVFHCHAHVLAGDLSGLASL